MIKVSATIITFNEEVIIEKTLSKLDWCDEIVIIDSGSTDKTIDICKKYGCRVLYNKFKGFGEQKQFAIDSCSNDWVLIIDADEVLSDNLQEELKSLFSKEDLKYNGYYFPFSTYYLGKILKFSGLKREKHIRLINRQYAYFTTPKVHEQLIVEGETTTIKNPIIHYTYRDITHHIEKINRYSELGAEELIRKKKHYTKFKSIIKFPEKFFTIYFIKGGFLDGFPGFMWSFISAIYASLKYSKFIEKRDLLNY